MTSEILSQVPDSADPSPQAELIFFIKGLRVLNFISQLDTDRCRVIARLVHKRDEIRLVEDESSTDHMTQEEALVILEKCFMPIVPRKNRNEDNIKTFNQRSMNDAELPLVIEQGSSEMGLVPELAQPVPVQLLSGQLPPDQLSQQSEIDE